MCVSYLYMCVCVYLRECVRAFMHTRVCVCVCALLRVRTPYFGPVAAVRAHMVCVGRSVVH